MEMSYVESAHGLKEQQETRAPGSLLGSLWISAEPLCVGLHSEGSHLAFFSMAEDLTIRSHRLLGGEQQTLPSIHQCPEARDVTPW